MCFAAAAETAGLVAAETVFETGDGPGVATPATADTILSPQIVFAEVEPALLGQRPSKAVHNGAKWRA